MQAKVLTRILGPDNNGCYSLRMADDYDHILIAADSFAVVDGVKDRIEGLICDTSELQEVADAIVARYERQTI